MPKFDVSVWKKTRPSDTAGSGIAKAIVEWNAHCPVKFDLLTDAKELDAADAARDQFLAALKKATAALSKSTDKSKGNPATTEKLLEGWEKEAKAYEKAIEAQRAELECKANVLKAQRELNIQVEDNFAEAIRKLDLKSKEFADAMKKTPPDLNRANASMESYGKAVQTVARWAKTSGGELDTQKKYYAGKYKCEVKEMITPGVFYTLLKKCKSPTAERAQMQKELDEALEAEAAEEREADASNSPEYKAAIKEGLAAYKQILAEVKAALAVVKHQADSVTRSTSIDPTSVSLKVKLPTAVVEIGKVGEKLKAAQIHVGDELAKTRNGSGGVRKKIEAAGLTKEDSNRIFLPQMSLTYSLNRQFLTVVQETLDRMQDWVEKVVAANPTLAVAKTELAKLHSRAYTVQRDA